MAHVTCMPLTLTWHPPRFNLTLSHTRFSHCHTRFLACMPQGPPGYDESMSAESAGLPALAHQELLPAPWTLTPAAAQPALLAVV